MFTKYMKKTTDHQVQVDLTINFFELANMYESDGIGDGGWFRCLLMELVALRREKVLIQGISELAMKWIASPDGLNILKQLKADYLTFTIAGPESNTSRGHWHDLEFDALFRKWSSAAHSSLPDSPFDVCTDIKTITIQLSGWYIYLKGYKQRPFPNQAYSIILPSTYTDYDKHLAEEKHWGQWRNAKYGIDYSY